MNSYLVIKKVLGMVTVLVLFASLGIVPATRAAGQVIYVDADASPPNDGTSWMDAFTDLQAALSAATGGDEIWVAQGVYWPTIGSDRSIAFDLKAGVAIYGGFTGAESTREQRDSDPATNNTVLSGDIGTQVLPDDNSYSVVTSSAVTATAVLDGFTITGGVATGSRGLPHPDRSGGGMHNNNSTPTLANLRFIGNQASWGGAMMNNKSDPAMTNIVFEENTASNSGGGLYNKNSNPRLDNVTFSDNTAGAGGGMYNDTADPLLSNVEFSLNTASGNGGGMHNTNSSPTLVNLTFQGDTAALGGGIYNDGGAPTLTNMIFSGETATNGAGIYNLASNPTATNLSLSGNEAAPGLGGLGGGFYNDASAPNLQNIILWGNLDSSGMTGSAQIYNTNGSTPAITHSLVQGSGASGASWDASLGTDGGGNLDDDPLFLRAPDDGGDGWGVGGNDDYGDLRLGTASLAINAGDTSLLPPDTTDLDADGNTTEPLPYDLNNNPRVLDAVVDMGAYEQHNEAPTISGTLAGQTTDDKTPIDPFTAVTVADPDGDTLTVTVTLDDANKGVLTNLGGFVQGPPGTYTFTGSPANATIALQGLTFDPAENRVPVGQTETTTFTILADDGQAAPATDNTTTVIVTSINDAPTAQDDTFSTDEDTLLTELAPGLLDNDTDPDADQLAVDSYTQPLTGTLSVDPGGSFTYMPASNFDGVITFTYTISDTHDAYATATVTVTVNAVNDPPDLVADSYQTAEDTPLSVVAPGLLQNDDDLDGDTLSVSAHTQPANGTAAVNLDGSFNYTPDANFFGQDNFNYTVCDDGTPQLCDTAAVTITVVAVNDPPIAVDDSYTTDENTPLSIAAPGVLDGDSDVDGDPIFVASYTQPANGGLAMSPDGSFTYTPDANYTGQDTFTYTLSDGQGGSDMATVTISVGEVVFRIYLPLILR
ncbi:MAG: Ig-like domain-containing protein [Anaerolineales bacterium]